MDRASLATYVHVQLTASRGGRSRRRTCRPALVVVFQGYLVQSVLAGTALDVDDYLAAWQCSAGLLAAD